MNTSLAQADDHVVAANLASLLQHIERHWLELLAHQTVVLSLATSPFAQRCELYIGDEFLLADTRYIDVVLKPAGESLASQQLPAVLVFEKPTARLVRFERNGLPLAMPASVGNWRSCADPGAERVGVGAGQRDGLGTATTRALPHCAGRRGDCHGAPRAGAATNYR